MPTATFPVLLLNPIWSSFWESPPTLYIPTSGWLFLPVRLEAGNLAYLGEAPEEAPHCGCPPYSDHTPSLRTDPKTDALFCIHSLSSKPFSLLFETRTFPKTLMNNSSSYAKFWDFPDDTQHSPFFFYYCFLYLIWCRWISLSLGNILGSLPGNLIQVKF